MRTDSRTVRKETTHWLNRCEVLKVEAVRKVYKSLGINKQLFRRKKASWPEEKQLRCMASKTLGDVVTTDKVKCVLTVKFQRYISVVGVVRETSGNTSPSWEGRTFGGLNSIQLCT